MAWKAGISVLGISHLPGAETGVGFLDNGGLRLQQHEEASTHHARAVQTSAYIPFANMPCAKQSKSQSQPRIKGWKSRRCRKGGVTRVSLQRGVVVKMGLDLFCSELGQKAWERLWPP